MESSVANRKIAVTPFDRRWASHLQLLESVPYQDVQIAAPLATFIDERIIPQLDLGTRKLAEKKHLVRQVIANLFLAAKAGRALADGRDTSKAHARMRVQVYDALEAAGFVLKKTGSEQAAKTTRYDLSDAANRLRKKKDFKFLEVVDVTLRSTTKTKEPSEHADTRPRRVLVEVLTA